MLNQAIARANLSKCLQSQAAYHPFPRYGERDAWKGLPQAIRVYYRDLAALYAEQGNPALPASRYMDFARDGNRSRYEKVYFERRNRLLALALYECMAADGALMEPLIDCIWAICEETTWVVPAHNNHHHTGGDGLLALRDAAQDHYVDLFAAETAAHLSWVYYLLGDRLAAESPLIPARIAHEIEQRVLLPYAAHDDFGWMGLAHDNPVNNWNPWINENMLATVLVMVEDPARRVSLVEKIGRSLQRFLDFYEEDGGCDEGPSYFNVAGGSMLDALALLYGATDGAVSLYDTPLIRNMARYIYAVHIDGDYYVNFADAPSRVTPGASLLLRAGKAMGIDDLSAFARYLLRSGDAVLPWALAQYQTHRLLDNLFDAPDPAVESAPYVALRDHYFPGIEVAVGRQQADSPRGLFFAAKGGHNAESHNHNDIGSYLLYLDGRPVVVDAGVETYSRKTFSAERYDIWTMQSGYHSTAIVDGQDQRPGRAFAAAGAAYAVQGDTTTFSLDMAGAYEGTPAKAFRRAFTFDRARQAFAVADEVTLRDGAAPTVLPLLTAMAPRVMPGELTFQAGDRRLVLTYDAAAFEVATEEIVLTDPKLQSQWRQGSLYRVLLKRTAAPAQDAWRLVFSVQG